MLERNDLRGYQGLQAFHKYWGKKPSEVYRFIIDEFSEPGQTILDPFVGSGVLGVEALKMSRNFIGIDINPVAVQMSKLLISPPEASRVRDAFNKIERLAKKKIEATYSTLDGTQVASHYLWNEEDLTSVWTMKGRKRSEAAPTDGDLKLATSYEHYPVQHIRPIRLFDNSRINTRSVLTLEDLFTGRALHNIDLLLEGINKCDDPVRKALLLCLTSAVGQMSKMVFAITGRGKTKGEETGHIEVGSWVIGYWRPDLHFEVNVWNTFARRVGRFLRTLELDVRERSLFRGSEASALGEVILGSASNVLASYKVESVDLIITDPPHGDRIPYLELSELWNAILGETAEFENEIVVSNARSRCKDREAYGRELNAVLAELRRILKPGGHLIILFNSRDGQSWSDLKSAVFGNDARTLSYLGAFESHYSAGSVVQDSRPGGLQHDYALVFKKHDKLKQNESPGVFTNRPGWTTLWPEAV
jgi:SAM-dependent methyltransferase